jgi:DNA-binding transcriptional ArsR family regulator
MPGDANLAKVAALIGEPNRAAMLLTLLAGRPQAASALADAAAISRQLASAHLRKLLEGDLLVVERVGRRRLFRLPNAVADAIEALLLLAPPSEVSSLHASRRGENLRRARICYDHLAGTVGVAVSEALVARNLLVEHNDGYLVTDEGHRDLKILGISAEELQGRDRPFARRCMDWSERRHHIGGKLGAALMSTFIELKWVRLHEASRVVSITPTGRQELRAWLHLQIA